MEKQYIKVKYYTDVITWESDQSCTYLIMICKLQQSTLFNSKQINLNIKYTKATRLYNCWF